MPSSTSWVVKLGGAMMHAPELRAWLAACAVPLAQRCIVVVGGGRLADEVRALQRDLGFDDQLAHELALQTMALNGRAAQRLEPALGCTTALPPAGDQAQIWIPDHAPTALPLPASWDVSADSVAYHLAAASGAEMLYLVKSCPREQLVGLTVDRALQGGIIDRCLPRLMREQPLPVRLLTKTAHADFLAARREGRPCGESLAAYAG